MALQDRQARRQHREEVADIYGGRRRRENRENPGGTDVSGTRTHGRDERLRDVPVIPTG